MESPEVAEFRRCILDADWVRADAALMRLGVADDERLWVSLDLLRVKVDARLTHSHIRRRPSSL